MDRKVPHLAICDNVHDHQPVWGHVKGFSAVILPDLLDITMLCDMGIRIEAYSCIYVYVSLYIGDYVHPIHEMEIPAQSLFISQVLHSEAWLLHWSLVWMPTGPTVGGPKAGCEMCTQKPTKMKEWSSSGTAERPILSRAPVSSSDPDASALGCCMWIELDFTWLLGIH